MNLCSQCGQSSSYHICGACRELNKRKHKATVVREHYTRMIEELLYDTDTLGNSVPASKMSASIMRELQDTSLKRIDDLVGFLGTLREEVAKIKAEVLV